MPRPPRGRSAAEEQAGHWRLLVVGDGEANRVDHPRLEWHVDTVRDDRDQTVLAGLDVRERVRRGRVTHMDDAAGDRRYGLIGRRQIGVQIQMMVSRTWSHVSRRQDVDRR